jgi:hypothetical protein
VPAALWGIGNPETVIRTAGLVDRLLIGCFAYVTAIGGFCAKAFMRWALRCTSHPKPLYVWCRGSHQAVYVVARRRGILT